jgi:predicted  nucleic acid-binding Zn-ribbon protein
MTPQIELIRIKNFLSITDVEIRPGQVNQVVGGNNAGKTTVLKALQFAVKGGTDPSLVRHGEESAEVVIELSDDTKIRRRVTSSGNCSLSVRSGEFEAQKPQAFLDGLFDGSAFNPLDLLDPKRRTDAVMSAIDLKLSPEVLAAEIGTTPDRLPPLDYSLHGLKVLDHCHRFYYQRRAEANKDAAEKKKRWETYARDLPSVEEKAPDRALIVSGIEETLRRISEIERRINENAHAVEEAERAALRPAAYQAEVDKIDSKIRWHEEEIKILRARWEEGQRFVEQARREVPAVEDLAGPLRTEFEEAKSDLERLRTSLKDCERLEAIANHRRSVAAMQAEYEAAVKIAYGLNDVVETLSNDVPEKLMSGAEMPVEGLAYHDGEFEVGGVPIENLSSSAALRLAVGVARKLAKKTKLVCIDGAEALDLETYQALREQIDGDGYTYFLTRVGDAFPEPRDRIISMEKGEAHVGQ